MNKPTKGNVLVCAVPYSLELVQENPDLLFVFGDNLEQKGTGGQACIRYAENSYGIPTKVEPTMDEQRAFFRDEFMELNALVFASCIEELRDHLQRGKTIVFPSTGLGNGYAQLYKRAPKSWELLNKMLFSAFNISNTETGLTKLTNVSNEVH